MSVEDILGTVKRKSKHQLGYKCDKEQKTTFGQTNHFKLWFSTKECYLKTKILKLIRDILLNPQAQTFSFGN